MINGYPTCFQWYSDNTLAEFCSTNYNTREQIVDLNGEVTVKGQELNEVMPFSNLKGKVVYVTDQTANVPLSLFPNIDFASTQIGASQTDIPEQSVSNIVLTYTIVGGNFDRFPHASPLKIYNGDIKLIDQLGDPYSPYLGCATGGNPYYPDRYTISFFVANESFSVGYAVVLEFYFTGEVKWWINQYTYAYNIATVYNELPDDPEPGPEPGDDPYSPGGNTGDDETDPTGGDGDFDNESDEIPIPLPPTTGAVDSGFITLYNPSMSQIQELGSFMWSDLFDLDTFKKIFADPMEAILGLSVVPVVPPRGSSVNVKIGNIQSGVFMTQVSSQFMQKDFGQITLNEYWGGYLDYSPYTQVEIYLPFIGVRPLSTDDVMGKTLHLVYNIDLLSGACMAFIAVNEDVLYQFIGQCSCSVPITGNDWTNVINGVLNIAGAIGTTVATGGLSAPQAVGAVTSVASSVVSSKPRVEKSGSLSGMGGMLGVFSPYLIITRPRQALPASQNAFQGYPSFITRTLGSISGFTRVSEVHLDNITCTDAEKQEIKTLLEQGVIL